MREEKTLRQLYFKCERQLYFCRDLRFYVWY